MRVRLPSGLPLKYILTICPSFDITDYQTERITMSNLGERRHTVTLETWLNNPQIQRGIMSLYAGEPFDDRVNSTGYEIGRQIAILAKNAGLMTRGAILRKKPNSNQMAIVKTKMRILHDIVYHQLELRELAA